MSDKDDYIELTARIVALEQLAVANLTINALDGATSDRNAIQFIDQQKEGMFASFQHADRPVSEIADKIWEGASVSLEGLFARARHRILFALKTGGSDAGRKT